MRLVNFVGAVVGLMAGAAGAAKAEDVVLGTIGNVRFVANVTERSPKQYQVFIKGEQTSSRASCHLFTASILSRGRTQQSGALDGTQSFLLNPEDFPATLTLDSVRVAYWDEWQKSAGGSGGYGNPCMSAKSGQKLQGSLQMPANPNMPCDSIQVDAAGLKVTQHLAISDREVRVELTESDSVRTDVTQISSISWGGLQVQNLGGLINIRAPASGRTTSSDRLGNHSDDALTQMEIICRTQSDANQIIQALKHLGR
jgi:hypothetical protein